jgi:hypothetical protein
MTAPKVCLNPACQREFVRDPKQASKDFNARKYCSAFCSATVARKRPVEPETKTCLRDGCGTVYVRGATEIPSRWNARKFCSSSCSVKAHRPAKAEPAPVVETTGTYRPVWRPCGFALRPGDEGYDDGVAS